VECALSQVSFFLSIGIIYLAHLSGECELRNKIPKTSEDILSLLIPVWHTVYFKKHCGRIETARDHHLNVLISHTDQRK
jgi:hypothetical protein